MRLAVLGDELTVAGWRLIGARTYSPGAREISSTLQAAMNEADMVIITAPYAAQLAATQMEAALLAGKPPVLVIADIANTRQPANLAETVARAFGAMQ